MPEAGVSDGAATLPALSPIERVVNTYIEPTRTFQDIRRNRSWWLPFLIIVIVAYAFAFAAMQHVGADTLATNVLHSQPRSAERLNNASPADAAHIIAFTKGILETTLYGMPVLVLLFNALFALLLWVGFVFVLGGHTTYGELFAVSIFAGLPRVLDSILAIVTVMVADPQSYNIGIPSPATLGYFVGAGQPHWLVVLAGSLNPFTIWTLVLTGLGAAIVSKVKPGRGILLVLATWIAYLLVKVGLAAAFGG